MKRALALVALSLVACSEGVDSQSDATSTSGGGTDAGMRAPGWIPPFALPLERLLSSVASPASWFAALPSAP